MTFSGRVQQRVRMIAVAGVSDARAAPVEKEEDIRKNGGAGQPDLEAQVQDQAQRHGHW